ncbi:MAG: MotA/TolQ/ExbB proton channel family protein [Myxococcales bacterium]|nr:MotA/TolQ/ExbB proton channel family protein [Myxococcales bacterium]
MLTEKLMQITLASGSEWVMVVLLLLSVVSLSIIGERFYFFYKRRSRLDALDARLRPAINAGDVDKIKACVERDGDPPLRAAIAGQGVRDRESTEKIVASAVERERLVLQKRLGFLGTLGNNAPFIGLFGTVLGIIRAFADLSKGSMQGHTAVMAGISEALVATAVGLFVAIPAVMAFNYFQRQVDHTLSITEALAQGVLANSAPESRSREPEGRERASASGNAPRIAGAAYRGDLPASKTSDADAANADDEE